MKTTITGTIGRPLAGSVIAILMLGLIPATPVLAQEAADENVNRIEVRDGMVYVNGEMVKELENPDARIRFSRDGESDFWMYSDDDNHWNALDLGSSNFRAFRNGNGVVGWSDDDHANAFALFDRSADGRFGLLSGSTFEPYVALFESNEEIRRLETQSRNLAGRLRSADADEKAALTRELTDVLNEIFDLKLQAQRERVERMSGELDELRSRIQDRSNARGQIIESRLRELTGERDALAW